MSVSFRDDVGTEFSLMFRVQFSFIRDRREVNGYKADMERYQIVERVSPVTGLVSRDRSMDAAPLSWHDASAILEQLRPLLPGFSSNYEFVFPAMVEIAKAEGGLPRGG